MVLARLVATLIAGPLLAAAIALAASTPARAEQVDLQLVLAIDVSGSVDPEEARLQRQGYIDAFADPRIIRAIRSGPKGRIAVSYFEWSDSVYQRLVVDWTIVSDEASAAAFAARLDNASISIATRTSISGAVTYAMALLARSPHDSDRRVVDVSGDGPNNDGPFVDEARDLAVSGKITINGLPIINDRPNRMGFPTMPDLDLYYQDCVIGGRGAFLVVAKDFNSFAAAIKQKLFLEIAGLAPHDFARRAPALGFGLPVVWAPPPAGPVRKARFDGDCQIGERQSHEFWRFRQTFPD